MEALSNTDEIIQNCNIQTLDTSEEWYAPRSCGRELEHLESRTPAHDVSPAFAPTIGGIIQLIRGLTWLQFNSKWGINLCRQHRFTPVSLMKM